MISVRKHGRSEVDNRRDMVMQGLRCGGNIALFDGFNYDAMPQCCRHEITRTDTSGYLEAMIVNEASVQDRIQRRKIGIAKNSPMEIPIECRELQFIIALCRLDHIACKRAQIGNKRTALVAQRPDNTIAFDLLPHAEHLDRFINGAS